jgi:hypothetical protein
MEAAASYSHFYHLGGLGFTALSCDGMAWRFVRKFRILALALASIATFLPAHIRLNHAACNCGSIDPTISLEGAFGVDLLKKWKLDWFVLVSPLRLSSSRTAYCNWKFGIAFCREASF